MAGDTTARGDYTADYLAASEAAELMRARDPRPPRVALILGTGLGGLAERIESQVIVDYADIPHFPPTTVAGHAGRLVLGTLEGVPVAAMRGRFHLYEGYTPAQVVHPLRALRLLGAEMLIVTNAAGGLDTAQHAGDQLAQARARRFSRRHHLGVIRLGGRAGVVAEDDVGEAADGEHAHAHVARGDDLRHGGHADGVRADRLQEAQLGGRLVVWPADHGVDAFAQRDAALGRERAAVDRGHAVG